MQRIMIRGSSIGTRLEVAIGSCAADFHETQSSGCKRDGLDVVKISASHRTPRQIASVNCEKNPPVPPFLRVHE